MIRYLLILALFSIRELIVGDVLAEECGAEIDSRVAPPSANRRRRTESADYPTRPRRSTDPVADSTSPVGSVSLS